MQRHHRITVDLAVQILRAAVDQAGTAKVDTVPTRLALRVLLPHCPERWPLTGFWESSSQENVIGREQGVGAAFNAICLQLKKSGAWAQRS
ncbi:hypothetical protein E5673_01255 [Sphingomonas sp. PAMC26645]|nr:hypothetical protein E5673_01255 [Sphingomonas sp. PAMC26645]